MILLRAFSWLSSIKSSFAFTYIYLNVSAVFLFLKVSCQNILDTSWTQTVLSRASYSLAHLPFANHNMTVTRGWSISPGDGSTYENGYVPPSISSETNNGGWYVLFAGPLISAMFTRQIMPLNTVHCVCDALKTISQEATSNLCRLIPTASQPNHPSRTCRHNSNPSTKHLMLVKTTMLEKLSRNMPYPRRNRDACVEQGKSVSKLDFYELWKLTLLLEYYRWYSSTRLLDFDFVQFCKAIKHSRSFISYIKEREVSDKTFLSEGVFSRKVPCRNFVYVSKHWVLVVFSAIVIEKNSSVNEIIQFVLKDIFEKAMQWHLIVLYLHPCCISFININFHAFVLMLTSRDLHQDANTKLSMYRISKYVNLWASFSLVTTTHIIYIYSSQGPVRNPWKHI